MKLSIVIPAYNEGKNLEKTIYNFDSYLKKQNYNYEILIVNDGSNDNTSKIAQALIGKFSYIKFIDNEINRGKGAAVRDGLKAGEGEYRLFIDADGATEINNLDKVWPLIDEGADVIIASRSFRDHPETIQEKKQALWKRFLGICGNMIIQFLTVDNIWDTQCGFKVFSKKALDIILPKMTLNRWAFDAEMLVIAQKNEFKIAIIPVVWRNSDFSRVGVKGYFLSIIEVIKIKYNLITRKY